MYSYIPFLDNPNMIQLIYFLTPKEIFYLTQVSHNIHALTIQESIKKELFKCIHNIFKYYERYYHVPFYTSHRTHLHILKIEFINQNFYIFTNKSYIFSLQLGNISIPCSYKIKHTYLKKIFKFYTSLVAIYYTQDLLFRALQYNQLQLLDLII